MSKTHHKINVYGAKGSQGQPRTVLEARKGSLEASESEELYRNWKNSLKFTKIHVILF